MRHFYSFILSMSLLLLLSGCFSTLPVSSSLDDFVVMNIKTENNDKVYLNYTSQVESGKIKVKNKSGSNLAGGYNHTVPYTFNKMLDQYLTNKFRNYNKNGEGTEFKVELLDFYLEQYPAGSTGDQVLNAFAGTTGDQMFLAKVKARLTFEKDGEVYEKIFATTEEDIYSGNTNRERVHGRMTSKALNKVMMLMNRYFEEIGY